MNLMADFRLTILQNLSNIFAPFLHPLVWYDIVHNKNGWIASFADIDWMQQMLRVWNRNEFVLNKYLHKRFMEAEHEKAH